MAVVVSSNSGKWHYAIKHFICDVAADVQDLPIDGVWPGSTAYVVDTCESYIFNSSKEWIKITNNSSGSGAGLAATIQVGNVTTGQPGSEVTITNSGTTSAAVFDFSIPRGEPFQIKEVYDSVAAMEADYNNPDLNVGDLVAIVSDPSDPDNASLYVKGDTQFEFFMDLSGAQGIQGPAGPQGEKGDAFTYSDFSPAQLESLTGPRGPQGPEGNGISNITQNPNGTLTITMDDGDQYTVDVAQYDYINRLIIGDNTNVVSDLDNLYNLLVGKDNTLATSDSNNKNMGNIINGKNNTINTTYHSDGNTLTGNHNSLTGSSVYYNDINGSYITSPSYLSYDRINGESIEIIASDGSYADNISGQNHNINVKELYRNNISGKGHQLKGKDNIVWSNSINGEYLYLNNDLTDTDNITGNFGFYRNLVTGYGNKINHYNSTSKVGYRIQNTLVGGYDNTINATSGDLYSSIIYGHQNTVDQINGVYGLTVFGVSHTITGGSGNYSTVMGYDNTLQDGGAYTTILGNFNVSQSGSTYNFISGTLNTVAFGAQYNTVEGYQNTVNSIQYSHVEGKDNIAGGGFSNIHIQGLGHDFSSGGASQPISVLGQYSNVDMTALEVVGNGTKNGDTITRSNARVLDINGNETLAGNLTIGGTPINNDHAATKGYVDTAVGASFVITHTGNNTIDKTAQQIRDACASNINNISLKGITGEASGKTVRLNNYVYFPEDGTVDLYFYQIDSSYCPHNIQIYVSSSDNITYVDTKFQSLIPDTN